MQLCRRFALAILAPEMRPPPRVLSAAALAFAMLALSPTVKAQSDADRATARALGQEGQAALESKDYATAEDRFRRADRLIHAPTLEIGLARALAGQHKFVEAQEAYNRIVREGVAPGAPAVFTKALEDAKKEVAAVSARTGSVTITVKAAGGAAVECDRGVRDVGAVNTASLGVRRAIDPGAHVLQVSADGYKPAELRFDIPEGGSTVAPISLETKAAAAGPAPGGAAPAGGDGTARVALIDASTPPDSEAPHKGLPRFLPWVAFGVGAAGLVAGGITGVLAIGKHSTLQGECTDGHCTADKQSDLDSYHSLGLISTVGFAVGGVGAAAGLVLLLTQPKGEGAPPAAQGLRVQPIVGLGTVGAVGSF
jgi:hypothetical protein